MLVAWNVRGLNKSGKLKEISSRLLELRPMMTILIETRVKQENAVSIRQKLKLQGQFVDNYDRHDNGRIWCNWDVARIDVKRIKSTSQLIHCEVRNKVGEFLYWVTAV